MKKFFALSLLLSCLLTLFACGNVRESPASPSPVSTAQHTAAPSGPSSSAPAVSAPLPNLADFCPIRENTRYVYEGTGNEFASYDVWTDYTSEGRVQQRVNNGGTELARVLAIEDGQLKKVYAREEAYYRENLLGKTGESEEILLMEPIEEGTSWTLPDSRVRTITDTAAEIRTPSGAYTAVEVVTEGHGSKVADYYAQNVGLVLSVFTSWETEVRSALSRIEENAQWKQTVRFYYPNADGSGVEYTDKEISFRTNDVTRTVLEQVYRELGSAHAKVFSDNTRINSLYLNDDGMVYLDLSKDFLAEMNAGSLYESLILQSTANTFCRYYNAGKMILTIDNDLYKSGHFAFQKGEALTADYE
jgi:hypothetical protein